eukprot:g48033.t1
MVFVGWHRGGGLKAFLRWRLLKGDWLAQESSGGLIQARAGAAELRPTLEASSMGKKTRINLPQSRRRPILQLEPGHKKEERGSGSEDEQEEASDQLFVNLSSNNTDNGTAKEPAVRTTGGLGLLGAYTDSEDDDGPDTEPQEAEPQTGKSADIDSTLANFMAEIDAITAPMPVSESVAAPTETLMPAPTPPRPEPTAQKAANNHKSSEVNATVEGSHVGTDWHYDTQYSLAGGGGQPLRSQE